MSISHREREIGADGWTNEINNKNIQKEEKEMKRQTLPNVGAMRRITTKASLVSGFHYQHNEPDILLSRLSCGHPNKKACLYILNRCCIHHVHIVHHPDASMVQAMDLHVSP